MRVLDDMRGGLGLLTRLPVGRLRRHSGAEGAWAWPLAGLVVGALAALAAGAGLAAGLPVAAAAGLALAVQAGATGGLHEDGLADLADGVWGGRDRARRLEIMKDSRIGSYGVIALVLAYGLRWSALTALLEAGAAWGPLLAAGALSRAAMPAVMAALPAARPGGLSAAVGRPNGGIALAAAALATGIALLVAGGAGLWAAVWVALVALWVGRLALSRLGGQTGDVLGAVQVATETAALLALSAFA